MAVEQLWFTMLSVSTVGRDWVWIALQKLCRCCIMLCAHSQTVYTAFRPDGVMWMYTGDNTHPYIFDSLGVLRQVQYTVLHWRVE